MIIKVKIIGGPHDDKTMEIDESTFFKYAADFKGNLYKKKSRNRYVFIKKLSDKEQQLNLNPTAWRRFTVIDEASSRELNSFTCYIFWLS